MDSMNRPSKRILRYMKLAAKVAQDSVYNDYRHGALLIRGGSVLNWSENKNQYCDFGNRFRQYNTGLPTVHAELGCILGVDKERNDLRCKDRQSRRLALEQAVCDVHGSS